MIIPQQLKIALVSGPNCGQSTIIQRFNKGVFVPDLPSTVTSTFSGQKYAIVNGNRIALSIWGTPGHQAYAQFAELSVKGASCLIFVFSIDNAEQFEEIVPKIKKELSLNSNQRAVLVGARSDKERAISIAQVKKAVEDLNIQYIECSSLSGEGIEEVFRVAVHESLKNHNVTIEGNIEFE